MDVARILIVEDESIVALDMQNRIQKLGYEVIARATSGSEAVKYAEAYQPDLILMDIRLQGPMDGIEAATCIRDKHSIPFVYLTAYSDDETRKRAKITEPYGYLIKPFEERELQTTIEMALYKYAMEQKVRAQAEQLNVILNTVPEGIVLLTADHHVITANPLGDDFLRHIATVSVDDRLLRLANHEVKFFINTPGVWHEVEIETPEHRIFEIVAQPTKDTIGGHAHQWVFVIHDVTQHREIWQRSLNQAQLVAVGQLAAGIAHDFNNILSILNLGDQMVLRTESELTSGNKTRLENNLKQIDRGSQLINQVLDFSRSSTLEPTTFDLLPAIIDITEMLERMLPENIFIDLQTKVTTCTLRADAARMQQVLMNLVINARDAMPNGGNITISVDYLTITPDQATQYPELLPGNWLQIQVSDDGQGIPEHILPRVFEPFFTTKPQGEGVGLGLAQVYGIVGKHEGHVDVISTVGKGTTVTLYFPALRKHNELLNESDHPNSILVVGTHETIMVVEDEPILRQNLCDLLNLLDYNVLDAANGLEALDVYNQHRDDISLILSDIVMPQMGGLDMCRHLRLTDDNVQIILMSGYSSELSPDELKELNVGAFLPKPMQPEILAQVIGNLLSRSIV